MGPFEFLTWVVLAGLFATWFGIGAVRLQQRAADRDRRAAAPREPADPFDEGFARVALPFPVPASARLVAYPGGAPELHGPSDLRWLIAPPDVQQAMAALRARDEAFAIRGPDLLLAGEGSTGLVADRLHQGLVRAYTARLRLGTDRIGAALPDVLGATVHGEVDGIAVALTLPWADADTWRARVTAELPDPLPAGTRLDAAGAAPLPRDDALGDLFLDVSLQVRADDPAAVRDRLARDEVRGALLHVVAGHPGSWVGAREITLELRDGALDLVPAIDAVVALANALRLPR